MNTYEQGIWEGKYKGFILGCLFMGTVCYAAGWLSGKGTVYREIADKKLISIDKVLEHTYKQNKTYLHIFQNHWGEFKAEREK